MPRGIEGTVSSGAEVSLFIRHGDVPFRESCNWAFNEFANKRIIGIILRHDEKMIIYGEIPVTWHPVR